MNRADLEYMVEFGFSREDSIAALKQTNGDVDAACELLLNEDKDFSRKQEPLNFDDVEADDDDGHRQLFNAALIADKSSQPAPRPVNLYNVVPAEPLKYTHLPPETPDRPRLVYVELKPNEQPETSSLTSTATPLYDRVPPLPAPQYDKSLPEQRKNAQYQLRPPTQQQQIHQQQQPTLEQQQQAALSRPLPVAVPDMSPSQASPAESFSPFIVSRQATPMQSPNFSQQQQQQQQQQPPPPVVPSRPTAFVQQQPSAKQPDNGEVFSPFMPNRMATPMQSPNASDAFAFNANAARINGAVQQRSRAQTSQQAPAAAAMMSSSTPAALAMSSNNVSTSSSSSSSSAAATSTSGVSQMAGLSGAVPECYRDGVFSLTHFQWFHGNLSAVEANELVKGTPKGTFLVRLSRQANHFVIVWMPKDGDTPAHIRISPVPTGYVVQGNKQNWTTIPQIINAWSKKHLKKPVDSRSARFFDPELRRIQSAEM